MALQSALATELAVLCCPVDYMKITIVEASALTVQHLRKGCFYVSASKKILIVEDNQASADVFKNAVELFGHEAECIYEWENAVGKISQQCFDIVFMDINLNNMSGITLMHEIKSHPSVNALTKFIAVSGYAEHHAIGVEAADLFDGYIEKPVSLDKLEIILAT